MDVYVTIINYVHKCYKCFDSGISVIYVGNDKIVAYKKAFISEWLENYLTHVDEFKYEFDFGSYEDVNVCVNNFISLLKNYNIEIKDDCDNNDECDEMSGIFDYIINDPYFSLILEIDKEDGIYGSVACNPEFLERWENTREDKFYNRDDMSYYKFNVSMRVLNDEAYYEE